MGHFTDLTDEEADRIRDVFEGPPGDYRTDVVCCSFGRPGRPCHLDRHIERVKR